jgi:2-phosphoglycerate kinase
VYWIGGGSVAGKSTVAQRLAARHGLRVYATDDVMHDHAGRSSPQEAPLLHHFMAMDMDERWVNRSPQAMLETFHWFRGECFEMMVEDLLQLRREPGVIAEGFRLLPNLVEPLLTERSHAVWLLPTPELRRDKGQWAFLARTGDPTAALGSLLERDRLFTDQLRAATTRLHLPTIDVDVGISVDELVRQVTEVFGL